MNDAPHVLLFEADAVTAGTLQQRLFERGLPAERRDLAESAESSKLCDMDIAVLIAGESENPYAVQHAAKLLERLVSENVITLVWGTSDTLKQVSGPMIDWLDASATLDEVTGRLASLTHYVPLMRTFERELNHMHRLGDQLNRYFSEIDQEMRLAGRLQHDFLPRQFPNLAGLEFGAIYRPASWVSGDMYDVFRIDEDHIGLFVADAMGHGVAAGLMTMFLRQSLVPKRIEDNAYTVLSPGEALTELHACLCRQQLPNCQFITAAYAVMNIHTRELRICRGGHPYPLHIRADGKIDRIVVSGGLLGLQDIDPDFEEKTVVLAPGEKLVLFSDGLEDDFFVAPTRHSLVPDLAPGPREWAPLHVHDFIAAVNDYLDHKAGSLHPADDITLLMLQASEVCAAGSV